jgi:hypothetical protein
MALIFIGNVYVSFPFFFSHESGISKCYSRFLLVK